MKTELVVLDELSGENYFSDSNTDNIIKELLKSNPNNAIRIGCKFSIKNINYEITDITIPAIVNPEINEVNAFVKLFVKKIKS